MWSLYYGVYILSTINKNKSKEISKSQENENIKK